MAEGLGVSRLCLLTLWNGSAAAAHRELGQLLCWWEGFLSVSKCDSEEPREHQRAALVPLLVTVLLKYLRISVWWCKHDNCLRVFQWHNACIKAVPQSFNNIGKVFQSREVATGFAFFLSPEYGRLLQLVKLMEPHRIKPVSWYLPPAENVAWDCLGHVAVTGHGASYSACKP